MKNAIPDYKKRSVELNLNTPLRFPSSIEFLRIDDKYVVVSPLTANWLVIESADQLDLLNDLISGVTIGRIYKSISNESTRITLNSLISQILAREFASFSKVASPVFVDENFEKLHVYLTNKCNLRCTHCYMNSGDILKDELAVTDWLLVVSQFADIGCKIVTFSGGELTTKDGWLEIIKHAHSLGLMVVILTNGTLWKPSQIEEVAFYIKEVQVSIDGPTEEANSVVRGPGTFRSALHTAISFSKTGAQTRIAMTPTPNNVECYLREFSDFVSYVASESDNAISINVSQALLKGRNCEHIRQYEDKYLAFQDIVDAAAETVRPAHVERRFASGHEPNIGLKNCGYGDPVIGANGEVYPCTRILETNSVGNIRRESISLIFEILRSMKYETSVDNFVPCKLCAIRYICGGGCRIDDFSSLTRGKKSDINRHPCDINMQAILRQMVASTYYKYAF